MKGHCPCKATGLSSHAIARRFAHCRMGSTDHPYDPSDLLRCVNYCKEMGISTPSLARNMASVSAEWKALAQEWDGLVVLLYEEMAENTGRAPRTYARMKELTRGDA